MNNEQENATLRSSDSQPLPPRVVASTKPCQKKTVWLAISIVIAAIILAGWRHNLYAANARRPQFSEYFR